MNSFIFIFLFSSLSLAFSFESDRTSSYSFFDEILEAFEEKDNNSLKRLIKNHFEDLTNEQKNTTLTKINTFGDLDILKQIDLTDLKERNYLLHESVNNPEILKYYLEDLKLDANSLNHQNESPLSFVTGPYIEESEQTIESVKILLSHGADMYFKNDYGKTPVLRAILSGKVKTLEVFVQEGLDLSISDSNGFGLLNQVFFIQDKSKLIPVLDFFYENAFDLNSYLHEVGEFTLKNKNNLYPYTLLTRAAEMRRADIIKYLSKKGIDLNQADRSGRKAIHHAARKNNKLILKVLVEAGVDVNSVDHKGRTALYEASNTSASAAVKILLDMGADMEIASKANLTPLFRAVISNSSIAAHYLTEQGANINVKNKQNQSLLYYALNKNFIKTALVLLSKNASLSPEEEKLIQEKNPSLLGLLKKYRLDEKPSDFKLDLHYKKAMIEEHLKRIKMLHYKVEGQMYGSSNDYESVNFDEKDIERVVLEKIKTDLPENLDQREERAVYDSFYPDDNSEKELEARGEENLAREVYDSFSKKRQRIDSKRDSNLKEQNVEVSYTKNSDRDKEIKKRRLEAAEDFFTKLKRQQARKQRVKSFKRAVISPRPFGRK